MSTTIAFTPKSADVHYTLVELNAFFAAVAVIVNGKLDLATPALLSDFNVGGATFVNLADALDADDAITVGQARTLLGLA